MPGFASLPIRHCQRKIASFAIMKIRFRHVPTRKTRLGVGVNLLMFKCANATGKCPSLAPTYIILEAVMICTLSPPKADMATIIGRIHANFPNTKFPNV